jgi:hypothetical protein
MKLKKKLLAVAAVLIVLFAIFTFNSEKAVGSETTLALYNSVGVGVVEVVKSVELREGLNEVPLNELSGLNIGDVSVRPLDGGVSVLGIFGQNPDETYGATLGSSVEIKLKGGELISGEFLGLRDGRIAVKASDYYLIDPGEVLYFKVKDLGKGQVYTVLKAEKRGIYKISVTYRVPGMNWESKYRLYIDDLARLNGYVVIRNPTPRDFNGTKVLLVAGDVGLYHTQPRVLYAKAGEVTEALGTPQKVEAFYLYRLGIVDVKPMSTSVYPYVSIEAPYEREYLYESWAQSGSGPVYEAVSFRTDKVLPAGTVEIYRKTGEDYLLIGEGRIEHTPANGTVRVGIGRDYDLRGTTTVLERKTWEGGFYYKVRISVESFGNETRTVIVRHHKSGKLISSSVKPVEETADYVEFELTVKPGEKKEVTLEYGSG